VLAMTRKEAVMNCLKYNPHIFLQWLKITIIIKKSTTARIFEPETSPLQRIITKAVKTQRSVFCLYRQRGPLVFAEEPLLYFYPTGLYSVIGIKL
jgi:hypothetical protein